MRKEQDDEPHAEGAAKELKEDVEDAVCLVNVPEAVSDEGDGWVDIGAGFSSKGRGKDIECGKSHG